MGGVVLGRTFPAGPVSLDFIAREYRRGVHPIGAGFAVQLGRSAEAAALDINEDVVEFPARRPRVTDGKGLVLDPARISTIENARDMNGAAVGIVGSGGALPDGWHVSEEWTEVEVLAVTVGDAFTTIDVRLTCDNSEGLEQESPRLRFAPGNGIPASPSDTWAGSVFAEVLSSNALKNRLALLPRNASGSAIVSTYASLPSVFSRVGVSATLPAGTVEVETAVQITVPAETNVVVELRLAVPMLELGAGVTSPIPRTNGEVVIGMSVVDASFAGAQEGEVGDTATAWERGANALSAPDMQGAAVGTVGSGGAMPTGWFNSSNIDTIEVLDVTDTGPFTRIDVRLTRTNGTGSNQTMQVRLEPGNGLAAVEGERWTMAMRSEILAGGAANPRLTVYARNSGGTSLTTNSVSLAGGGAETVSTLTMPASTAYATPTIQATAAPSGTTIVTLRLWLPHFAEDVDTEVPVGLLPTGWGTDGVDTIVIDDLDGEIAGEPAMDVTMTKGDADDAQLRLVLPGTIAAAEGETWVVRLRSEVLDGAETDPRLSIAARNGANAIIASAGADLAGGGALTEAVLTMPAGTASVTAHVAFDGPGTVELRLAEPVLALRELVGATDGARPADDARLFSLFWPDLASGRRGAVVIEAEERAAIGDGVILSLDFGSHHVLLHGGSDPGLSVVAVKKTGLQTIGGVRMLPTLPGAIVRAAIGWTEGTVLVAFSSALDGVTREFAVPGFAPSAEPRVRLGTDATGGRAAVMALRSLQALPILPTLDALTELAADPGMPNVPSPWRLYRHAWTSPALSSVQPLPYWEPETYDTSDTSIGWTGGGDFDPPESQTVPPDMIVPSMYGPPNPDNPGRDVVHEPSYALFLAIVTPIRQFQKDFVAATDAYRSTGAPAAAFALAGGMLQAAEAGVLSGARNDTGTAQIERWLGTSGSAWLKICRAGFGTPEERATIESHLRDMADQLIAFQLLKRATRSSYAINNHYFWAAWGIAVVGLILGERDYIDFGHECLEFAIDASADAGAIVIEVIPGDEDDGEGFPGGDDDPDPETEEVEGTQPAEVVRLTRATHYHNFAMPPLVALAEIAIADGRDPYARRNGQLHKMAEFTATAVDDPSIVTAVQEAILGEGNGAVQDTSMWTGPEGIVAHRLPNGSQMSWMWIYARRFPDRTASRVWAPRFHEVYTSLRSSNLGGDMRVLYPWRHTTPAVLAITGGMAPSTTAAAPALAGTAEPGAKVTVTIGDAEFITTAGSGGAWSLSLPGFAVGTYAVAAVQETALGIHPPKRATLTVIG